MDVKLRTTLSVLCLLSLCPSAKAATECMFTSQSNVNITYSDTIVITDEAPPANGFKQLTTQTSTQYIPSTEIHSTCNAGQDGQAFSGSVAGYQGSLDIFTAINGKNVQLYGTSIPGIFYAVKMYSKKCPEMGGYVPPSKDWTFLYDVGDDDEKSCLKSDEPYYFDLAFFMNSDYQPREDTIAIQNIPIQEHGNFKLSGTDGDDAQGKATVETVQFVAELRKNATECPTSATLLNELQNNLAKNNQIVTAQHRGDFNDTQPENSLGAFHLSYDRCRANVETDVRATSDGELVVFHDLNIGKMLEPTYDPIANSGPNVALSSLTLAELQQKYLVNVATRQPTTYTVPTVNQLIDDYIAYNGQSLIYLETKSSSVIMPTALALYNKSVTYSGSNLLQRIIMKVNMAEYPSPDLWNNALINAGIPAGVTIMIDPVITPNDASKINDLPDTTFACPAGISDSKAVCAVRAWANAPATLAPMVSVLIKDSADFEEVSTKQNEQGSYDAPANFQLSNTVSGTVAEMVAVIKGAGKALEIFSPVPDYMLWKNLNFYTETVYDKNIPQDISVREAFYNNDSSCCYRVLDKLSPSTIAAEKNDYRMNLGWLRDIGANVITADDTDSINTYFSGTGVLDRALTPHVWTPSFYMQSILSWQLGSAVMEGKSLASEKDAYALYNNNDSYAWTYRPDPPIAVMRAGYYAWMSVKRQPDGRVRISPAYNKEQCLRSALSNHSWDYVGWKKDCTSENTLWEMQPKSGSEDWFSLIDAHHMSLGWAYSGKLYYAYSYGYVYVDKPSTLSDPYYWSFGTAI